jgi:aminopeptidase N
VTGIAASFTEQDGVPLILAETACNGGTQRLSLRQDRFVVAPKAAAALPPRSWKVPVAFGPPGAKSPDVVLLQGSADIAAGACGEPVKVNLGDIGYYRVEYGPASGAALARSLAQLAPEDRVNFLADGWAMVQAGRAEPPSWFVLVETLSADDRRPVWEQVISVMGALNRLSRDRAERPALQNYARAKLRPVFDRLGWDGSGSDDDDTTLLRASLIRTLGELGDEEILGEAKRRFAGFLQEPKSLPNALRDSVTHLVGLTADRATYDTLLRLARKTTAANERLRYFYAAASARNADLARATLKLSLTDEVPGTAVTGLINSVASSGEQPDLAWAFVRENFDVLLVRQGPPFRDQFVANLMTNFSDEGHAAELTAFAPAQVTSGGRVMTARALETIAIAANLKARALPAVDAWIRARGK